MPVLDSGIVQLAHSTLSARELELQSRKFPTEHNVVNVGDVRAIATRVFVKVRGGASLTSSDFLKVLDRVDGVITPAFEPLPKDGELAQKLGMDRMFAVLVPRGTDLPALLDRLKNLRDDVEWAEPDLVGDLAAIQESEPSFTSQWAHKNTGQDIPGSPGGIAGADMKTAQAWAVIAGLEPVTVCIVDTGVSQSHPEFAGLLVGGRNWTSSDTTAWDDDTLWSHGTQCAGIAAALGNNAIGITGTAPNVRLLCCKMATRQLALLGGLANAIIFATDNGARVVSMSLSFTGGTTTQLGNLQAAVNYAISRGVILVAATGNSPGTPIGYPAQYPSVIAVGATTNRDEAFDGQTTGPEMDVSAPGRDILTTVDLTTNPNGYANATGTSMAVPHVAGLAALILGINPALSGDAVRAIIESTVDDLGPPGRDDQFGFGRINAYKAVLAARDTLFCSVDVDLSGGGSVQDIFSFLAYFFSGDLRADSDRNGVITVNDVFLFLQEWFVGCP